LNRVPRLHIDPFAVWSTQNPHTCDTKTKTPRSGQNQYRWPAIPAVPKTGNKTKQNKTKQNKTNNNNKGEKINKGLMVIANHNRGNENGSTLAQNKQTNKQQATKTPHKCTAI